MSQRGFAALGVVAAGGVGYYLYTAGGDPKAAEKHMEADVHKASAKIQQQLPGRSDPGRAESKVNQAEARGEAYIRDAGNKAQSLANDAERKIENFNKETEKKFTDGKREAESLARQASSEFNKKVDKFDATVTNEAAKAKSGISSWFGGK